ncbi:MAG: S66 peptidase family protein [Aeoliella sp.]
MFPLQAPPLLKPGDAISLIAPSGPVDEHALERAIVELERRGYRCKTHGDLTRRNGYLAGTDDERAAEFNAAVNDPETCALLPVRGGYGASRILDRLDYQALARYPKSICGFSDITALHSAVHRYAGLATFHGPNLQDGIGHIDGMDPVAAASYWQMLTGQSETPPTSLIEPAPRCLVGGFCEGPVVGGNLAVLAALVGTPYEIETKGCILLLEDVGEATYRVDRMLAQLRLTGMLDEAVGIVLGQFTDCETSVAEMDGSLEHVFNDYFACLSIPVIADYPVGHDRQNTTVPLGLPVQLDADRCLLGLESA